MVGEESTTAVFQIIQITPTVTAEFPKMQERKEGQELVLTAKFDGSPPPTAIWLLEGTVGCRKLSSLVSWEYLWSLTGVSRESLESPLRVL